VPLKPQFHSFTQSLRIQLKNTNIIAFELAPPITATSLFKDDFSIDDVGVKPMDVKILVQHAINDIKRDQLEIRPGLSNLLKFMTDWRPTSFSASSGSPLTACWQR
jgi:uncharacterized oxidoreductase